MILNKLLIRAVAPPPKIEKFKRYLFVGPHPDDIEIAAGSTVSRLCREGKEVHFLICTDGRYGTADENLAADDLVRIRQKEQLASAKILGVKNVVFLPYHDGGLYNEDDLRKDIAKNIVAVQPDVVFCADYQLYTECHPDHLKSGRATSAAYSFCSFKNIMKEYGVNDAAAPKALAFFYTGKPNYNVMTTKQDLKNLYAAFDTFKSQFPVKADADSLKLYMKVKQRINGLRSMHIRADAFRVQNNLTMHCCAEAEPD